MAKKVSENGTGKPGIDNPFPGLRPFTPMESDLFFGREGQSDEVLLKLKKNRFVTIIGSSGSGKSSLIYCGIIPKLQVDESDTGKNWKVLTMRPGNDPVGNMIGMISDVIAKGEDGKEKLLAEGFELRNDPDALSKALAKIRKSDNERVLLLVDQFEELFRFSSTRREGSARNESKVFVNQLVNAVNKSDDKINIIITMRSDFIGECAHYQGLTDLINESNYLVPQMGQENYRHAIIGPIEYAGASIESELVETLLGEIGERTDQLPVLQHALMRTWSHWKSMNHPETPISSTNYDAVGQMAEAMSRHSNEAYEELDERGKEICQVLFKTITEKGSDNKGIRHPTKLKTIAAIARCSVEEMKRVIEVFRQSGRSFLTPGPGIELDGETVIDVSHESLMRLWSRLSGWVDEEASSVQMYLRLSEASEMFQDGRTTLWRPPDLQLALNWRNDNIPTLTWAERYNPAFERAMVYLRTSEKEFHNEEENKIRAQKRQLRRSRITAMILGTAAIISVFFMLFAFVNKMQADRNALEAELNAQMASEQRNIAERQADTARINAQEAALQAIIAERQADTAKINAEKAREQEVLALQEADRATREEQRAKAAEAEAVANRDTAIINEQRAIEQEREARRLRMVSIGKSMSVKSLQLIEQGDLQGLLAYQAYLFNNRNGGVQNDADIFMGLYNFIKNFGGTDYEVFKGLSGGVQSIVFNPVKGEFFTAGVDGKVLKWNIENPEMASQTVFSAGLTDKIEVLATSPDGKLLAGGSNPVIRIFPLDGGGIAYQLSGHTKMVKSLAFSPDSKYLYSCGLDGQILRWDVATREKKELMKLQNNKLNSLDVSASGKYLAGATELGQIHVWNLETETEVNSIESGKGEIQVVRFKGVNELAVGYKNGILEIWDIDNSNMISTLQGHSARITGISFNHTHRQVATTSTDGSLKLWNYDDFTEPPIVMNDNDGYPMSVMFSPDGSRFLTGTTGDDLAEGYLVARPTHLQYMVQDICQLLNRNFTEDEWRIYVAPDIDYEETCGERELSIRVQERKGEQTR